MYEEKSRDVDWIFFTDVSHRVTSRVNALPTPILTQTPQ